MEEELQKVFIVGYGPENDIDKYVEHSFYDDETMAIEKLTMLKQNLVEFDIVGYRIEIFYKNNNKCYYSGKTIRLNHS